MKLKTYKERKAYKITDIEVAKRFILMCDLPIYDAGLMLKWILDMKAGYFDFRVGEWKQGKMYDWCYNSRDYYKRNGYEIIEWKPKQRTE